MVRLAVLVMVCALVCAPAGHAADNGTPASPSPAGQSDATQDSPTSERLGQPPSAIGSDLLDALHGDLLRDFHKERKKLEDIGITFSLHERSEVWADVSGGGHRGVSYNGLTVAKLDLDLDKLFGWSGGELFTSAFDVHGHGPSRSFLGNQQLVSNIEATPSVKLYDLWLDQSFFDKKLSIRFGQEAPMTR